MKRIYVINKITGSVIKSFGAEETAKEFASKCNSRNGVESFSIFIYESGSMSEI